MMRPMDRVLRAKHPADPWIAKSLMEQRLIVDYVHMRLDEVLEMRKSTLEILALTALPAPLGLPWFIN